MSIIHDALKKAQEERKNKKQEVPYNPPGTEKKPKILFYAIIGVSIVAVVIAYLYVPYFQRPKQGFQSMDRPVPVAPKTLQSDAHAVPDKTIQKTVIPEKNPAPSVTTKERSGQETVPFAKAGIDEKKGDLQNITGESPGIIIRKAEDHGIDRMYNEALKESQSGRVREAKSIYKQILAKKPNHTETLNNLGVMAMDEDNRTEALFYFKRILEYQKNYAKAYNNIGLVAMKNGDNKLAEEYFRKGISIEPDSVEPYLNMAALMRSEGRFQEAAKLLDIPIQKKIKDPSLFLSYAVIKDNLGEYEDAAHYYRRYLSLLPAPGSRKDIIERLKYIEEKR